MDDGRKLFLSAAIPGAGGGRPPGMGGAAPGGFGADARGGLGAEFRDVSGSERYGELLSLPVLTPPDFLSFGIPPANKPPNWGAALAMPPPSLAPSPPVSLLLLARFPGAGGARPEGGAGALPIPGTGGAPPMGGPPPPSTGLPTCGADRSFTWATFFSRAPPRMSPNSAPCARLAPVMPTQPDKAAKTYSSSSSRRFPPRSFPRHRRWWRWSSGTSTHRRHGRRGRWWRCGHGVV